jgi:hypothetical protein
MWLMFLNNQLIINCCSMFHETLDCVGIFKKKDVIINSLMIVDQKKVYTSWGCMPMTKNIWIACANRSIDYARNKNYVEQGEKVFAACRKSTQALRDLLGITVIGGIDTTDDQ